MYEPENRRSNVGSGTTMTLDRDALMKADEKSLATIINNQLEQYPMFKYCKPFSLSLPKGLLDLPAGCEHQTYEIDLTQYADDEDECKVVKDGGLDTEQIDEKSLDVMEHSEPEFQIFTEEYDDDDLGNPELHLKDPDSEVLFDYTVDSLHDITNGRSAALGKHLIEMIDNLLPQGVPFRDKVISTVKGNLPNSDKIRVLNDIQQQLKPCLQKISSCEFCKNKSHTEMHSDYENNNEHVADQDTKSNETHSKYSSQQLSECGSDHSHSHGDSSNLRSLSSHDRLYEYRPKERPDFHALLAFNPDEKPICMFCEYYLVFGKPPRQMMKWYNQHGAAGVVQHQSADQHEGSKTAKNKKKKKKSKKGKR
ncbi:HBR499Wp [Eremothecium sinecaudum]|uniref:Protein IBD2 n=1 Tax=Eremothecium sinecaudum TaxID=45286 RepID=A0A109UXN6_9SACH|nr:HBR499Wp [Eremothecium sinecaudum]AMD19400.1 HBR499Wp [Eremothecium sinecaudum]